MMPFFLITFEVSILLLRFTEIFFALIKFAFPFPFINLCLCLFFDTFKAMKKIMKLMQYICTTQSTQNNQVNIEKLCQK